MTCSRSACASWKSRWALTDKPKLEITFDGFGNPVYKVSHDRVLLSREEHDQVLRIILQLKTENDKLREYASALAKSQLYGPCDWCPYKDDEDACDCDTLPMRDGCKFRDELRELGVKAR